jgi:hypothetical protein
MDPLTAQHSSISPCGGGVPLLSACRLPSGSRPVARIPAPRRLMEKANGSRAPAGSNTPGVAPCARRARRVCRGRPPGRRRCPRRGAGDCQCSRDGAASVNRGRLAERGSEVEDGEECLTSEPLLPSIVRQRLVQLQSPLPNRPPGPVPVPLRVSTSVGSTPASPAAAATAAPARDGHHSPRGRGGRGRAVGHLG